MPDSLILDVVIGLVFVFALMAFLAAGITELISRVLGLRADYLLRGLRSLVDGDANVAGAANTAKQEYDAWQALLANPVPTTPGSTNPQRRAFLALTGGPILGNLGAAGQTAAVHLDTKLHRSQLRKLPSYISSTAFANAVLDLVLPQFTGSATTQAVLLQRVADLQGKGLPEPFVESLTALAKSAGSSIDEFRTSVQTWYDNHMERVSGWYKRRVRWITLGIGIVLVLFLNVNAVSITRALYTDQVLRDSVVAAAIQQTGDTCKGDKAGDCVNEVRSQLATLHGAGLPLGWGTVPACASTETSESGACNFWQRYGLADPVHKSLSANLSFVLALVLGWGLIIGALLLGGRFWFDLLSKLGSLRSSGPKPTA